MFFGSASRSCRHQMQLVMSSVYHSCNVLQPSNKRFIRWLGSCLFLEPPQTCHHVCKVQITVIAGMDPAAASEATRCVWAYKELKIQLFLCKQCEVTTTASVNNPLLASVCVGGTCTAIFVGTSWSFEPLLKWGHVTEVWLSCFTDFKPFFGWLGWGYSRCF